MDVFLLSDDFLNNNPVSGLDADMAAEDIPVLRQIAPEHPHEKESFDALLPHDAQALVGPGENFQTALLHEGPDAVQIVDDCCSADKQNLRNIGQCHIAGGADQHRRSYLNTLVPYKTRKPKK